MRILIAWELGENYGHVLRQLPVAKLLRARGHDILFAAKDIVVAEQVLGVEGFRFVQVPVSGRKKSLEREIASFADILSFQGFGEQDALLSLVHAWQCLYQLYQPDVVLIDHAPSALFAARISRFCTVQLGTGFEIPPPMSPYPSFRPWLKLSDLELLKTESNILANLNHVCDLHRQPRLQTLDQLMCADAQLLTTFPEIDHYPDRKSRRYIGPLFTHDQGLAVDWPSGRRKNIFVYLRLDTAVAPILNFLSQIDANIICVIPHIDSALKEKYQTPSFHIYSSYVKLDALIGNCDLAITHSGHGVIAACILAGIPMLVLPTHVEQMLLARCVVRSGMGLAISLDTLDAEFSQNLKELLTNAVFADRAQMLSAKYASYDKNKVVERIANTIERLPAHVADKSKSCDVAGRVKH